MVNTPGKKMSRQSARRKLAPQLDTGEVAVFREAVRDATPIRSQRRAAHVTKPPPIPVHSLLDIHVAIEESFYGPMSWEQSMESGEELVFLRENLPKDILRKLRRGHWVVQDSIDLHGLTREQARKLLVTFLSECIRRGLRCLRVVHGKGLGSPNRDPVLRGNMRAWLEPHVEILAYCQAPENLGGSGATLVLLRNSEKSAAPSGTALPRES